MDGERAGSTTTTSDQDIPEAVRQELMRCAVQNGRISYHYLCAVYRHGRTELASDMRAYADAPQPFTADIFAWRDRLRAFADRLSPERIP